jgi:ABC-2 type transport system permease protein
MKTNRTRLSGALSLAKKEIYGYTISPVVWGIAIFFLVFIAVWLFYFQSFLTQNTASLRALFAGFPLVFILVIPGLTMKSWAEERKTGSVELLLTLPYSEWDLVLGKFLAAMSALLFMLALTVPLVLTLLPLGAFDGGVIVCEYIGAVLLGASAVSLGLLLSALSKSQAAASLGSAAVMLFVMLVNQITATINMPAFLSAFINYISLSFHFESFSRGLLDTRDAAFFILSSALFLFLNTRVLLFRKWS